MSLDVIRFSVGPWNGRYSSVWRIWSNPGSDDVYLGVSTLLRYMKVSLHESGMFRVAFVKTYNEKLVEEGKDGDTDRAFLKWDKAVLKENEIMQVLDIHFPLAALSLNREPNLGANKRLYLMQPHENSLGDNDTVTMKAIFTKLHPRHKAVKRAFEKKNIVPFTCMTLDSGEYMSFVFEYTKTLPIDISKREADGYAAMLHDRFIKSEKTVGDRMDGLTIQLFRMGMPPSIYNVGQMSALWKAEKEFSIEHERETILQGN